MRRAAAVTVRDAAPDDLPDLLALWQEVRHLAGGARSDVPEPSDDAVLVLLARARSGDAVAVRLGMVADAVAGVVVAVTERVSILDESLTVRVACLFVHPPCRRRGVGHALLADVGDLAQRWGATSVTSSAPPQLRDAHRFFARAGFGPWEVRRVASLAALRRGSASGPVPYGLPVAGERVIGAGTAGAVGSVVARRRALRGRTADPAGAARGD